MSYTVCCCVVRGARVLRCGRGPARLTQLRDAGEERGVLTSGKVPLEKTL
jgi:hypothetical protein